MAIDPVSDKLFHSLLTKDDLSGYEDPTEFEKWIPKIKAYRQRLADAIPKELTTELPKPVDTLIEEQFDSVSYLYNEKLLSPKEFEITDSSGSNIVNKIARGEWTSVEVYKAFAKRAIIAHQFTNCAMEFFIDEGVKRVEELDAYYKKNGYTVGPLHGLPISLKEHIALKGKIGHVGCVSLLDNIMEKDSVTAKVLYDLGAVFYIRTNEPQALLHLDSGNNITGFTKCPYNLLLSSGGSSSGEGAVVAFGGSVMGVGSDIGGSIRSPAAFSGCHGLRPTSRRISGRGVVGGEGGQESVVGVIGPLSRTIEDIELFMRTYINNGEPWNLDPWSLPMKWRDVEQPKISNLKIAVVRDDGVVRVSPPIRRGLDEVVNKLKAAGATIVEFTPPRGKLAYDTAMTLYNADGNKELRELFSASGEPIPRLTKWYLNAGEGTRMHTTYENRLLNATRDRFREQYTDYMVENKIDFILGPAYNNVAPHSEEVYNESYTIIYNLLDFPSLVFQTGLRQDPEVDTWTEEDKKFKYRNGMEELEDRSYDPKKFKGAPIALQLSGRRYFDEEVVAAGKAIVDLLEADLLKPETLLRGK
ncbi:hypothetical protein LELG_05156 [Lodderomyces elongisporus NRRL YB-4239]|uniref:amidase n=1 Tax=Lodderomyces elongisporus (strain ATCC 11503 / CBS 2605 / JCM 1781 / NBRC 1676 / NRRL YB-4239) TaxID=379508 RepID=A5E6B7_LODEL|nr:hypothetical protein LELG_05156 [Lodderomyces elongisporus NRRL YB-4239]